MKCLILILSACFSFSAGAQTPHPQVSEDRQVEQARQIMQAGKLFSVRMVPGQSSTSFFVVGKKAADIKIEKLQVEATFFENLDENKGRTLVLKRQNDHFLYEGALKPGKLRLNIKTEDPAHQEKIEVKMGNP